MPTISLDSDFEVYASLETADAYLDGAIHADAWRAADDDTKNRSLVTATRLLDRQKWRGEKTASESPGQPLEWPRKNTGITGVEDDVVPDKIIQADIELALSLLTGSDVQDVQNTGQKISSLRAGSASISYFRGAEGPPVRFPMIVWELVRDYLVSSQRVSVGSLATGTERETVAGRDFGYTQGL